ncbi:MAG: VWA domain-containing protein [Proteobacteria bacterium]|nr:VWA domain-containing protein [Pseudomonadota bacterium]
MMRYLAAPLTTLGLRVIALLLLGVAVFAPQWVARELPAEVIVLLDRSASVPENLGLAAWRTVQHQPRPAHLRTLEFAGSYAWRPGAPRASADASLATDSTNIAQALGAGLQAAAAVRGGAPQLVLISDGYSTLGDPEAALRTIHAAAVPLCWIPIESPPAPTRIISLEYPGTVAVGEAFTLTVRLEADDVQRVRVDVRGSDGSYNSAFTTLQPGRQTVASLPLTASGGGVLALSVSVHDEASGEPLPAASAAALVAVRGPAHVLYISDTPAPLATSLVRGGWPVERLRPSLAPASDAALRRFQAVVLDDVSISQAPEAFWATLARQVRDRGLGLVVLGGPGAFARGGYRGSLLETLLPVTSEPDAGERSEAVGFLVDKSGSMGRSSAGVDRLTAARSAVIAAAGALEPEDELLLVAFDVEPRLLVPLQPYRAARAALEAPWPIHAAGGTRMVPALAYAAEQLGAARSRRHTLVLVTDGYISGESAAAVANTLKQRSVDLVVLAIGTDANVGALRELTNATGARVMRVADVAQLPQFARAAVERRRGRVEFATTAVRERMPLPFAAAGAWAGAAWPPVAAYAVTRARAQSQLFLVSAHDDPLLAAGRAGSGRVVVLPAGLNEWAPAWVQARWWPQLAGSLIEWTSSAADDPGLGLRVSDGPDSYSVQAELIGSGEWSDSDQLTLRTTGPDGLTDERTLRATAPGRFAALLPHPGPGLYTITAAADAARTTRSLLHVSPREGGEPGTSAQLRAAVGQGLLRYCAPQTLARSRAPALALGEARRALALGSLLCFLAALLIDFRARWLGWLGQNSQPKIR